MIRAAQVALDHLIRHGDEGLVRALAALHARLAADTRHPLVGAGRCVAGTVGLGVLPAHREDVGPTREQIPEEGHLRGRRRDRRHALQLGDGRRRSGDGRLHKFLQPRLERSPLFAQLGEPAPDRGDLPVVLLALP